MTDDKKIETTDVAPVEPPAPPAAPAAPRVMKTLMKLSLPALQTIPVGESRDVEVEEQDVEVETGAVLNRRHYSISVLRSAPGELFFGKP